MTLARFHPGLLDPDQPAPEGLGDGRGHRANRRYDVYRNNVTHSLVAALETAFPLVRKLLGGQAFDQFAPVFVRQHPPSSPLMMHFGREFPDFLAAQPDLARYGYLPDCARLDLALRASYHAADADPFDLTILQSMPPDDLPALHLSLMPATIILLSRWPLFDLWRFNMVPGSDKPRAVAQDVLITRLDFDPTVHALPPGGAAWLGALQGGMPFGAAIEAAESATPDFDLQATLTLALTAQAFSNPSERAEHG